MKSPRLVVSIMAVLAAASIISVRAAEKDPTIKEIMKLAHKGETAMVKKAADGKATPEELRQLLTYYKAMALQKPPKGDMESWKEKSDALVKATEKLVKGEADGPAAFKKASNCRACHTIHRPPEEKK